MYGKIFAQMYDGTLVTNWKALVTFQQMIVLCGPDGVIDITPQALSARTSIPLDIIKEGIAALERPDPGSRTPDQEGRRIERLDAHRDWGWVIVNYRKYRMLVDGETVREQNRVRQATKRDRDKSKESQPVTFSHALSRCVTPVTPCHAKSRQAEAEVEAIQPMSPAKAVDALPPGFEAFWKAYPHVQGRSSRAESLKRWKAKKLEPISSRVLAAVTRCRDSPDWLKDDGSYVQAAEVWLGRRLWEQQDQPAARTSQWQGRSI